MIAVLTGNYRGGVFQFAQQIAGEFEKMGKCTVLFAPDNSEYITESMQVYKRLNSLNPFAPHYQSVADRISAERPELVFVCDSNLVTARIVLRIDPRIPVYMCVHDAKAHPNYETLVRCLKDRVKAPYIRAAWRRVKRIIVLSENTKRAMAGQYPALAEKLDVIRLGAHPPRVSGERPAEMGEDEQYFLFFGRMDRYKGIVNLLEAYTNNIDHVPYGLVLAGDGVLTEAESEMIQSNSRRIRLIKRYIPDAEMVWLFQHAKCVVLPYIEASQSGVLSMAYHYGKPVIASDLDGLKEFIVHGQTGLIYSDADALGDFLVRADELLPEDRSGIDDYVRRNLDWSANIQRCLGEDL